MAKIAKFKILLIIDDNEMDSFVTKIVVERVNLAESVVCLSNAYNALDHIQTLKRKADAGDFNENDICVFLDIMMPYMNAGDFLNALDKFWPSLINKIFIVSGLPIEEQSDIILREDVGGYIDKPLTDDKVRNCFLRKELK